MQPQTTEPEWEFTENRSFLFEPHRYKVAKGGRNGTKSWGFARALLVKGFEQPLRILCAREVQRSIKESVHQLLKDQTAMLELDGFYDVLTSEIRGKNGTLISFVGLSALTSHTIKSYEGYDICWVEEAALVTRRSWDILLPTIRKTGSEIWVTFNPELDTDETWVRFIENTPEDCHIETMSFDTNPWITEVAEKERLSFLRQVDNGSRTQDDYNNIWLGMCKPAVDGAIYPDEVAAVMESGRLCPVPYDPMLMVHVIYDIGWNDYMSIGVVQVSPGALRIIDYIEDDHRTYEWYVNGIDAHGNHSGVGLLDKPYAKKIKKMYLPHDGRAHNPQTGKSDKEILESLLKATDIKTDIIDEIGVKQGIQAARQMFNRVYFDKVRCTPLFNRLRRYARVISPTTGEAGLPKHDENSHGADMFRYIAVIEKQLTNESEGNMKPIKYDHSGVI